LSNENTAILRSERIDPAPAAMLREDAAMRAQTLKRAERIVAD
jgi:hypothetical protein